MGADLGLQHRIEQLLFREADCLDRRDWDGWEALFAPDGMYWVPLGHDQADPLNHASLFFETRSCGTCGGGGWTRCMPGRSTR